MKPFLFSLAWIAIATLGACKDTAPSPAPEPAPEKASADQPAESSPSVAKEDDPSGTVRRERAGIDLAAPGKADETIDGRPQAARLVEVKEGKIPARLEGDKLVGAKAARAFVSGPWTQAVESADGAALIGLLADPFTGLVHGGASPGPVTREGWPKARGGVGTPITLGGMAIAMVGSAAGDATIRFFERRGEGEGCRARQRELTLTADSSNGLRVRVASAGEATGCAAGSAGQVAAAHQELVKLWKEEDRVEAASTTPSIWLRDHGLDVRTYDRAALHGGDGQWVLDALSAVTATEENTTMAGPVGRVVGANGVAFSYYLSDDGWTLQGVDRAR
jgi:hypothetical protein